MAFKFSAELSNSPQNSYETASWEGVEMTIAGENISAPTVWSINENRHALIVHLGGTIDEIETEIDRRASKLNPPTDGEFWLIPANSAYFTFTRGATVRYAEFYIEPDYLKKILGANADKYNLSPQIGMFDKFLYQNVEYLASLVNQTDDIAGLMSSNLSQTLCLHLFRNYNENRLTIDERVSRFTPVKFSLLQEFIQDNLSEQITLERLADLAGMSSDKLLRVFPKSFGTTPAQYVINQRLRKVRWMLSNTKKNITTIAYETGFSSHSHLTTTFKKNVGFTPQMFRKSQISEVS